MPTPGEPEVFRHSLKSVVEEMGVTLQRTAYSTNIKIRRDHTCAIFDAGGRHLSQHDVAPQHIGTLVSMVPKTIEAYGDDLNPGDGILVNDPYVGDGSIHLPDVALVSPIYHDDEIVGYTANSAHHVDIGGGTPGGIPNDSTELYGEGVIMPGVKAVEGWEYDEEILKLITRNVRGADMRLGDYRAQLAANHIGDRRYGDLVSEHGVEEIGALLDELLEYTERRVRAAIAALPDGTYTAEDLLDGDGVVDEPVRLTLAVRIDGDEVTVDFTGTAAETRGPLNCTPALAFAGVVYALMAIVGEDLPKNAGFYRPLETVTPDGTIVNPSRNRPVAAAAEVSVRAADLVLRALADAVPDRTVAAGKGTICNVAYGGHDPRSEERYVYYETVAGGYGARAQKDGMDAVQAHFQNTANSPIEELETEIPLYVRRYELVQDSAGAGRQRGGLGVERDIEFYGEEASFSVLADRARFPPWGLFGGESGEPAAYAVIRDGEHEDLSSKETTEIEPGDVAVIRTPGGGGYGDPTERDPERVLADIESGKVSVEAAREEYGVVVEGRDTDEDGTVVGGGTVDEEATAQLREELREERR